MRKGVLFFDTPEREPVQTRVAWDLLASWRGSVWVVVTHQVNNTAMTGIVSDFR